MSVNWRARVLALALFGGAVAGIVATLAIASSTKGRGAESAVELLLPAFSFALIGAVVVWHRQENRLGWIFLTIALLLGTGPMADEYAGRILQPGVDPSAPAVLAAWYSEWFWIPWIFLAFGIGVLWFPTGRAQSPRWSRFGAAVWTTAVVFALIAALDPMVGASSGEEVANPIGISPLGDVDDDHLIGFLFGSVLVAAIGSLTSLTIRFRRSRGEERQQIKWVTYSAAVQVIAFVALGLLADPLGFRIPLLDGLVLSALPIGAGIAILRFRLYDIDLLINRTLVYGALTGALAALYLSLVVVLQQLTAPLTSGSDIAVAASTLAVAALFGPARSKIQRFIDRRFYRARYDARETIHGFSDRLRDQVELDGLRDDLLGVVKRTVGPDHASVWLRERG